LLKVSWKKTKRCN
ncbi:glnD PII-uridylyltransferase family protein, partial [Vibrio parahaemolyticus V-223/04]